MGLSSMQIVSAVAVSRLTVYRLHHVSFFHARLRITGYTETLLAISTLKYRMLERFTYILALDTLCKTFKFLMQICSDLSPIILLSWRVPLQRRSVRIKQDYTDTSDYRERLTMESMIFLLRQLIMCSTHLI